MILVVVRKVVWKVVRKVVRNPFFGGFCTVLWYFSVPYCFCTGVLRRFYVLWSARGDLGDDGRRRVTMGWLMSTGFGQFWSDLVKTWPVRSGRCGGCHAVVGSCWRSVLAEHGSVLDG